MKKAIALLALAGGLLAGGIPLGAQAPACASGSELLPRGFESRNKATVQAYYQDVLGTADAEAVGAYFAEGCIQHDPRIADGRAGAVDWIRSQRAASPALAFSVKHVLADGQLVLVHAQLSPTPQDETTGRDRFDLYRLADGLIVEHWAVQQRVFSPSASGNSMFSDLYGYSGRAPHANEGREEANRLLAVDLSNQVFGQRRFDLLERFWAVDYIQHNPFLGNGRAELAAVLDYIAPEGSHYRVAKSVAEGDLVWVFAQSTDPGVDPADEFTGAAVCDLYRVVDFQLVEHWDAAQGVPPSTLSGHSMFSTLYQGR